MKGFSNVLFVAREDLALQVCTHRIHLIPPAGVREREEGFRGGQCEKVGVDFVKRRQGRGSGKKCKGLRMKDKGKKEKGTTERR